MESVILKLYSLKRVIELTTDKVGLSTIDEAIKELEVVRTTDLTFGDALVAVKLGKKIARIGWNGAGMFVYYVPAASYQSITKIAVDSFPLGLVPYREYLALKTAQGDVATWSPSTSDSLADDWVILE